MCGTDTTPVAAGPKGIARYLHHSVGLTQILVAADPNSLSGKASKAQAYGIPIITEDAFERLLGTAAVRTGS